MKNCPKYLLPYEELWKKDPHAANLEWFRNARYGLFMHYGLYSMLHKKEWVLYREQIPLKEYEALKEAFTAHNFDADKITDLAIAAGMKYITITACHHEGFCLWDSKIEPFNSMNSPAKRDLIRELSEACERKGLGFFVYYTFMLNWRYPYFIENSIFEYARPRYKEKEPRYQDNGKESFSKYLNYIEAVIDELLSNYSVTGIWFDIIVAWYILGEEYIPIEQIYENIRKKHPEVLISWKQGATGTEDFASPEQNFHDMTEDIRKQYGDAAAMRARRGFEGNRHKHNEICATIQRMGWGFNPLSEDKSVDELYQLLGHAAAHDCNLLLNVGPMADGGIHPRHKRLLLDLAEKIKREGFPTEDVKIEKTDLGTGTV
ncbi:hypothetical protein CE91St56_29140 [Lachnospiraceae bacterium]|nr:hypothetical protein CE91St56_29140 [Lachnospiraceae bacterium]GKH41860.1 hypothetical protein CE91St57_28340 [Lachnospiraceae bacterium]